MYHRIVDRLARRTFDQVNRHEYDAILRSCSRRIRHQFGGDHALGGIRRDREALRAWFERLGRLCPDMHITVHDVWVKGTPRRTTAIIRWTNAATRPDGSAYANRGVHVVEMRWGKAVSIDANEDSQAVVELLDMLAATGVDEAHAAPITS